MTRNIRPKQGHALVKVLPNDRSDAGIHFAPKYQFDDRMQRGQVLRLGVWNVSKSGRLLPYELKPGDLVLFPKNAGRWLHDGADRLKLLPTGRILALIAP